MKENTKNYLTLFSTAVFLLIILEIFSRIYIGPPLIDSSTPLLELYNDSERKWGNIPLAEGYSASAPYVVNSEGFRDSEWNLLPPDIYKIALLGDSITFGKGVNQEETFSEQLELELNKRCKGKFEVMNFGVYGYSTLQELSTLKEKVLPFNPDAVFVIYALNDPDYTFSLQLGNHDSSSKTSFLEKHSYLYKLIGRMYTTAKNKENTIFEYYAKLHNPPSLEWKSVTTSLKEAKSISLTEKFKITAFVIPEMYHFKEYPFKEYHLQFMEVATQEGIKNVDLLPLFQNESHKNMRVHNFYDRHPNAKAHVLIAKGIFENIKNETKCL